VKKIMLILTVLTCLLLAITSAFAGTTVIQVDKDMENTGVDTGKSGQWDGQFENKTETGELSGAMVWGENGWVANNTWAHKYFKDMRTGNRIKDVTEVNNVSTDVTVEQYGQYTVTKTTYTYTVNASVADDNGGGFGTYTFSGVDYVITSPDGTEVLLRSRGAGIPDRQSASNTTGFFNVYIKDANGKGTTALVGDPVMIHYTDQSVTSAALRDRNLNQDVRANLPGNGVYMLDTNGGSHMGGVTYRLNTGSIGNPTINTLGGISSFTTGMGIQYTDSATGQMKQLNFSPSVSQTYTPPPPPPPASDGGDGGGGGDGGD